MVEKELSALVVAMAEAMRDLLRDTYATGDARITAFERRYDAFRASLSKPEAGAVRDPVHFAVIEELKTRFPYSVSPKEHIALGCLHESLHCYDALYAILADARREAEGLRVEKTALHLEMNSKIIDRDNKISDQGDTIVRLTNELRDVRNGAEKDVEAAEKRIAMQWKQYAWKDSWELFVGPFSAGTVTKQYNGLWSGFDHSHKCIWTGSSDAEETKMKVETSARAALGDAAETTTRKPFKLDVTKEWCMAAAQDEGDQEVGVGALANDPPIAPLTAAGGALALEAVKYYADREGRVHGPMRAEGHFYVCEDVTGKLVYYEDGEHCAGTKCSLTLIREVPAPSAVEAKPASAGVEHLHGHAPYFIPGCRQCRDEAVIWSKP